MLTNQGPENNQGPALITFLKRTGILDCPGKPPMQKLEQNKLIDIEIANIQKFFTFLDYFQQYNVQTSGFLTPFQWINLNSKSLNLSWERDDKSI